MSAADPTRPVRAGEELPLDRLLPYLENGLGTFLDAQNANSLTIEQFPGGHSNLTYLLKIGGKELVLRRPPFGSKVKSAHDMGREYRLLSKLSAVLPRAPKPLLFCEDESLIGSKFYVMQRLSGLVLRRDIPSGLNISPEQARALCSSFVDTLVELHAIDFNSVGLGDFGQPKGYVERQISGWAKRYEGSRTDDIPEMERIASWLLEHKQEAPDASIIHNDYKYDNLLLNPSNITEVVGILDWEMATLGDPRMDLGTTLCYWVEAGDAEDLIAMRMGPTAIAGSYTRRELAEAYARRSGRDLGNIVFYYCFGLYKTAVVLQQIYYRYAQGLTKDPRFGKLIHGVRALCAQAARYINRSEL